jgi:hypothetical protein
MNKNLLKKLSIIPDLRFSWGENKKPTLNKAHVFALISKSQPF